MTMNHDSGLMNGGVMWVWTVVGLAIIVLLIVVVSNRLNK